MEPLTITQAVKEKDDWKKGENHEPSFISQTALKLCFVSQLSAIISISCLHESETEGEGGGTGGRGLLKKPFTQPGVVTWIQ